MATTVSIERERLGIESVTELRGGEPDRGARVTRSGVSERLEYCPVFTKYVHPEAREDRRRRPNGLHAATPPEKSRMTREKIAFSLPLTRLPIRTGGNGLQRADATEHRRAPLVEPLRQTP